MEKLSISIEQKAKAYDEALKKAKDMLSYKEVRREDMEYLFPELKESEDERIRKALICGMYALKEQNRKTFATIPINDCITWLEKQGKQKPVFEMKTPEESLGIDSVTYNKIVDECIYGEQKPAWSEEDEHRVKDTIYFLDTAKKHYASTVEIDACIAWLKSLKERIGR